MWIRAAWVYNIVLKISPFLQSFHSSVSFLLPFLTTLKAPFFFSHKKHCALVSSNYFFIFWWYSHTVMPVNKRHSALLGLPADFGIMKYNQFMQNTCQTHSLVTSDFRANDLNFNIFPLGCVGKINPTSQTLVVRRTVFLISSLNSCLCRILIQCLVIDWWPEIHSQVYFEL